MVDCEQCAALRAEVAWHVEDKNKWQDTQAAHLREVTRLTAEVEKLKADIAYADTHAAKVESLLWGTAQENDKLRAALKKINVGDGWAALIARAALEGSA